LFSVFVCALVAHKRISAGELSGGRQAQRGRPVVQREARSSRGTGQEYDVQGQGIVRL